MCLQSKTQENPETASHHINTNFIKQPKEINLDQMLKDNPVLIHVAPYPAKQFAEISFTSQVVTKGRVRIYDMQGNLVYTFAEGIIPAGKHTYNWNLKSSGGIDVPRGFYRVCIITDYGVVSTVQILVNR